MILEAERSLILWSLFLLFCGEDATEAGVAHRPMIVAELSSVVFRQLRCAFGNCAGALFVIRLRATGTALWTGCLEDVRHISSAFLRCNCMAPGRCRSARDFVAESYRELHSNYHYQKRAKPIQELGFESSFESLLRAPGTAIASTPTIRANAANQSPNRTHTVGTSTENWTNPW